MKIPASLFPAVITGSLLLGAGVPRAGEHHHHKISHPASSLEARQAIRSQLDSAGVALEAGNLAGIHDVSEAINAAVPGLDKDSTLDATKKKRVKSYGRNIKKLSDKMHLLADAGKLEETRKEAGKLKVQVDLLDKQFPHEEHP
jgi:hypothetical protein